MKSKQFDVIAKELFSSALEAYGFSCDKSRSSVFYREVSPDCFHAILPDLGTRGAWYDVKAFPFATVLDPLFEKHLPDSVGAPTDTYCYLSKYGVGRNQVLFSCETEEEFRRQFASEVGTLLAVISIPYLEQFSSLKDMLPFIHRPLHKAIATQ